MMRAGLTASLVSLLVAGASACSVPVFRYALDRWPADNFRLEVPAATPLPETPGAANLEIIRDNPNATITEARLFFPNGDTEPAWRGSLDESALRKLTDSPARRELTRRIVAGDTAVWIIVEHRNAPANSVVESLETQLRELERTITLPSINPRDPADALGPGPRLEVKFSILRLDREDPAEAGFLPILLGPKRTTGGGAEPLVVPVFGRARALGAWPASRMNAEQTAEICRFLCGACSCEVKALNPGWDLLVNFDWDAALAAFPTPNGAPAKPLPAQQPNPSAPALVPIAAAPSPAPENPAVESSTDYLPYALLAVGLLTVISGVLTFRGRRS